MSPAAMDLTSRRPLFLYLVVQSSAQLPGMSDYCSVLSCAQKNLDISPEQNAPGSRLKYLNGCPFPLIRRLVKKLDINLKAKQGKHPIFKHVTQP